MSPEVLRRRQDLPWRTTLRGIVVARGHDVLLLERGTAVAWDVLEEAMSMAELEEAAHSTYPELPPEALRTAIKALASEGLLEQ